MCVCVCVSCQCVVLSFDARAISPCYITSALGPVCCCKSHWGVRGRHPGSSHGGGRCHHLITDFWGVWITPRKCSGSRGYPTHHQKLNLVASLPSIIVQVVLANQPKLLVQPCAFSQTRPYSICTVTAATPSPASEEQFVHVFP